MDASHHQPWLGTGTENLMMVGFPVHGGQALHGQERASSELFGWLPKVLPAIRFRVSIPSTTMDGNQTFGYGGAWVDGGVRGGYVSCFLARFHLPPPPAPGLRLFPLVRQCFCQITRLAAFGRPNRQLSSPKVNFGLIQFLSQRLRQILPVK